MKNGTTTVYIMIFKKAQLSLEKADRTTLIRSPPSNFQSQRESDFSEVTQFHARCSNEMLLSKATINASTTDSHVASWPSGQKI